MFTSFRSAFPHPRCHGLKRSLCATIAAAALLSACSTATDGDTAAAGSEAASSQPDTANGASSSTEYGPEVQRLKAEIIAVHPFNPASFTQGLEIDPIEQRLLVGTGWYGETQLYATSIDNAPADVSESVAVPDEKIFGEGITRVGDTIWQLTWRNGFAYKRDAHSFEEIGRATYSGEGWGLCNFGSVMVMSDGTSQLRLLDPETFVERSRVRTPVDKLNELDCSTDADGRQIVWANRFLTKDIVGIDLASGDIVAVVDASNLQSNAAPDSNNVLNGIAAIPGTDHFLLSGKRWPQMYEVRFVEG